LLCFASFADATDSAPRLSVSVLSSFAQRWLLLRMGR
jgi:hypothetical protein